MRRVITAMLEWERTLLGGRGIDEQLRNRERDEREQD